MAMTRSGDPARALVWLGRLLDVVLLAVIAVGLCSVILGRVLPAIGHPVYVVAGPSMAPAIPVGAAVVLDRIPTARLAVGDVVSLQNGAARAVFTHRIIRIAERDGATWVETQGDANAAPDPAVTPATSIIGRVGLIVPFAGYALALLSTVPGLILVLSTGATLLILGWLIDQLVDSRRRVRRAATAPASAPLGAPVHAEATAQVATAAPTPPTPPSRPQPVVPPATPFSAVDVVRADPSGRHRRRRSAARPLARIRL